jgi:type VI secretion system protein ImpJ
MKAPQRVVWSEGMFMAPQHLQQADLYHEALLRARMGAMTPYDWGVVSLEVDEKALAAGQFHLLRFFGILPDGLPLIFERGQPEAPPARPVEEHFGTAKRAVEVFLGVARERDGVASYGNPEDSTTTGPRFNVVNRSVPDLMAAESMAQVPFAQRNLRFLFGTESREDYEAIKIAELVRDRTGAVVLSPTYVPSASSFITQGLRIILKSVLGKQRELADARRHRDAASLEFTGADVTRFLQLSVLNGLIPQVVHAVEAADLTPQLLYLMLCQGVGQLSTFSPDGDPSQLPKFQFTNLRSTFMELFTRLQALLDSVVTTQCLTLPLEARRDGMHLARLEDEQLLRCTRFILAVRSELPESEVAARLPHLSKVASWEEVQDLVRAATPGVPLEVTFRPPPEVPVRPGVVYFSLGTSDGRWKNILSEHTVAVFLPQPFDPQRTKLELLGIPGAEK